MNEKTGPKLAALAGRLRSYFMEKPVALHPAGTLSSGCFVASGIHLVSNDQKSDYDDKCARADPSISYLTSYGVSTSKNYESEGFKNGRSWEPLRPTEPSPAQGRGIQDRGN